MHEDQARPARGSHSSATPRSVDELEKDTTWRVHRTAPDGRWITAERRIELDDHQWRVGLTPVTGDLAALIVWADGEVVVHRRGAESELCATACDWIDKLARRRDR